MQSGESCSFQQSHHWTGKPFEIKYKQETQRKRVSCCGDDKVLEIDSGGGHITLWMYECHWTV